jgi:hypothetical protein
MLHEQEFSRLLLTVDLCLSNGFSKDCGGDRVKGKKLHIVQGGVKNNDREWLVNAAHWIISVSLDSP